MLKRFELHNHTTESDASITCAELVDLMARDRVDAFALTDHNTISGHRIVKKILEEKKPPVQCVYGMEYTTYYGHILCLNLRRYVPWDSIDRNCPEKLFRACREAGALAGIAHPFSYGAPFARGCRFEMTVTDFSQVDFIEVFNNSEPLHEVNERGLDGWQALVLRGEKLAATSGMDLHGARDMSMNFATYVEGEPNGDPALELERAIRSQQTWLSKGLALRWSLDADGGARFWLEDVRKPGFVPSDSYLLSLTDANGERTFDITAGERALSAAELGDAPVIIPKLYGESPQIEDLVCLAPVIRR